MVILHAFDIVHARNGHISTSCLKSDVISVFLDPQFLRRENYGNSCTFKADVALLIFAWIFRTSWPKMGGGVGSNELVFTFTFTSVNFGENWSRNATVCTQMHGQTDPQTQTGFISVLRICYTLYCYGQFKIVSIRWKKPKFAFGMSLTEFQPW